MRIQRLATALGLLMLAHAGPAGAEPAAARMARPGPEATDLRARVGTYDVVATLWPAPGAAPVVTRGLIAERTMVGSILQETMRPAPGSAVPDFRRLDFLDYDRVESRWKYVSMDTRFPVSIMPAASFGPAPAGRIEMQFQPQAFVGFGPAVEGRFMLSDMIIERAGGDREIKRQHVNFATGDGKPWLFVQYEYSRRSPVPTP